MATRAGYLLSVILLVAFMALGAFVIDRNDLRIDLSPYARNTLSPQTIRLLEQLDRPVRLVAFFRDVPADRAILSGLVELYQQYTDLLELEFVDLDRRPELAESFDVTANRTVILTSADLQVRTIAPNEPELTGALVRLLSDRPPRVAFLSGYNGASIEDASPGGISRLAELIAKQNFLVESVSLATASSIPRDVDCVVLAAPEGRMGNRERELLVRYLLRGGRLLAMLEPLGAADVDSMLVPWGLLAHEGFIIDPSSARENIAGPNTSRIALSLRGAPNHPITQGLDIPTLFPIAKSFETIQPPPPGVEPARLVQTLAEAWLERNYEQMGYGEATQDPDDIAGPLGIGYAVRVDLRRFRYGVDDDGLEATLLNMNRRNVDFRDTTMTDTIRVGDLELEREAGEEARLVVFGDVDFVNNANLLVRGNSDLFLGSLLWLTDQENRIAIAPRAAVADPIVLTERQKLWIRILGIGVGPGLALVGSVVIFWRRSRWL